MTAAHAVLRSLRSLRTARAGRAGCPDAVKTARTPFRKVCSFQLTEVCSFQLPLTVDRDRRGSASFCAVVAFVGGVLYAAVHNLVADWTA